MHLFFYSSRTGFELYYVFNRTIQRSSSLD